MKIIKSKRFLLGLILSIFFIALLFKHVNLQDTLQAFKQVNLKYMAFIIPLYYLSFVIRAFRWNNLLVGEKSKFSSMLSALFVGFFLNGILPARMGDFYRAYLFGKETEVSRVKTFSSIVIERILDGSSLFLLLVFSLTQIQTSPWMVKLAYLAGFVFIGSFVILFLLAKNKLDFLSSKVNTFISKLPLKLQNYCHRIKNFLYNHFKSFLEGLGVLHSFKDLIISFTLSLLLWCNETFIVILLFKSFSVSLGVIDCMFILSTVAFSTLIPAGPGGVGPFQWGYILASGVFGVDKALALAVSIIHQAVSVLLVFIPSLAYFLKSRLNTAKLNFQVKSKIANK